MEGIMDHYFVFKDKVDTAGGHVAKNDRDIKEVLGDLINILEQKELLLDKDIARLLGVGTSDIQRLPF